jgi:hypothetical protein
LAGSCGVVRREPWDGDGAVRELALGALTALIAPFEACLWRVLVMMSTSADDMVSLGPAAGNL